MTIKEIKIQYEENTEEISFLPAKDLSASTQVQILGNVLAGLVHQQCRYFDNTKEQRTEILEALFKDMQDQLTFIDEE